MNDFVDQMEACVKLTIGAVPTQDDRHGRESAHRNEEEGTVLQVNVVVHLKEDDKSRERYCDHRNDKQETLSQEVRERRDDHGQYECARPWGDR